MLLNLENFRVEKELDVAKIVMEAKSLAGKIGFSNSIQNKIAITVSELGKNIIQHARVGEITLKMIQQGNRKGLEIIAKDKGPGIESVDKALTEHYSTRKSLGLGLPAVKRMMDETQIKTQMGKGTTIIVKKWLPYG